MYILCKICSSHEIPNDFVEHSGHLKQNGLWILESSGDARAIASTLAFSKVQISAVLAQRDRVLHSKHECHFLNPYFSFRHVVAFYMRDAGRLAGWGRIA